MRITALLTLAIFFAFSPAEAQVKRGGLFGFGSENDQISSDLFPNSGSSTESASAPTTSSMPDRNGDDGIFRGGSPSDVDAVSYVIENGERVAQAVPPKKKGFFSFGKKTEEAEPIEPVPSSDYVPANVIQVDSEPIERAAAPEIAAVEEVAEEIDETTEAVMEAVNEPIVEEKKKSGGIFGFFGKKDEIPDAPAFAMEDEVVTVAEPTRAEPAPAPAPANPYEAPAPSNDSAPAPVTAEPTPTFATTTPQPQAEPEKEGFRLTNPIAKLRSKKPEKTIDLTGAETIIQNGEIVAESTDIVDSNRVTMDDGVREPPRIVDGVTTYSSWDDVEARSDSAADKILNQIR
ncbi:MAG: hypothetical protein AAGF67_13935 [Verrucomicrobiota bacterium]